MTKVLVSLRNKEGRVFEVRENEEVRITSDESLVSIWGVRGQQERLIGMIAIEVLASVQIEDT